MDLGRPVPSDLGGPEPGRFCLGVGQLLAPLRGAFFQHHPALPSGRRPSREEHLFGMPTAGRCGASVQHVDTRKVLRTALWSLGQVQVGSQNLSLPDSLTRSLRTMVLDGPTITLSSRWIRRSGW